MPTPDSLLARDVKDLITECFFKCFDMMKDASDTTMARDVLDRLEAAEDRARRWQVEGE